MSVQRNTQIRTYAQFKRRLSSVSSRYLPANTTAVLKVTDPAGTVTTPTVITEATGRYSASFLANSVGDWRFQWSGTGISQVASKIVTVRVLENL